MKIFKYDLNNLEAARVGVTVTMPEGAKVLSAGHQNRVPMIWAMVNPNSKKAESRRFRVYGTGWPIEGAEKLKFINTYQQDEFVWHVFEVVR